MAATFGEQTTVRCVMMRGGTSRGLYFHAEDLPLPGPKRDKLLERLMGAPDVLEIDGLGGSRPITSKVAMISRSQRQDADVDYTFAQVEIDQAGGRALSLRHRSEFVEILVVFNWSESTLGLVNQRAAASAASVLAFHLCQRGSFLHSRSIVHRYFMRSAYVVRLHCP